MENHALLIIPDRRPNKPPNSQSVQKQKRCPSLHVNPSHVGSSRTAVQQNVWVEKRSLFRSATSRVVCAGPPWHASEILPPGSQDFWTVWAPNSNRLLIVFWLREWGVPTPTATGILHTACASQIVLLSFTTQQCLLAYPWRL